MPISFSIDEQERIITIYDNSGAKAIDYNIDSFKYVGDTIMPFHFSKCLWMNNSSLAFYVPGTMTSPYDGQILVTNKSFDDVREYAPVLKTTFRGYSDINYLYRFGNENRFILPNEGVVYAFDNEGYDEKYQLSLHKPFPPSGFFAEEGRESSSEFFTKIQNSIYVSWYEVLETSRFLTVRYLYEKEYYFGLYDKILSKSRLASSSILLSDSEYGKISMPITVYADLFVSLATDPENSSPNPSIILYSFKK